MLITSRFIVVGKLSTSSWARRPIFQVPNSNTCQIHSPSLNYKQRKPKPRYQTLLPPPYNSRHLCNLRNLGKYYSMENQPSSPPHLHRAEIDTARPFRSVKEAVAIFGERILVAQKPNSIASSSPSPLVVVAPSSSPSSHTYVSPSLLHFKEAHEEDNTLTSTLQKLETELEKTKRELKLLEERESENEIALASLNAELHKNMSRMAEAEAAAAARAVAKSVEEKTKAEKGVQFDRSPTLAQILKLGEEEGYFGLTKEQRKKMKKKPIIPLIGDLFSKKKSSTTSVHNPLFNSCKAFVS